MPQPKQKKKYRYGFKKWSDETSVDFRKKLDLKASEYLCAFKLCDYLNIPLLVPSKIEGLNGEHLENLLGDGSNHWSAASIPIGNGKFIIVHNPTHSRARQQSNLMHELAHIICKHEIPEEKTKIGLSGFLRNHDEQQENEAEWLGGCLQLPKQALFVALKSGMSEDQIAEHFNASKEMVRFRANISGVKKQLAYMKKKGL